MSTIVVGVAVAGIVAGGIKAFSGFKAKREAREKQEAAEKGLHDAQDRLKDVDTSNPWVDKDGKSTATNAYAGLTNQMKGLDNVYDDQKNVYAGMENKMAGQENRMEGLKNEFEGMENAMEDLTVNTQQADFEAQQNQQMQANLMSSMGAAAGGSGIAALAQSMANQGALQAQKASASIGAQESENTKKAAEAQQDIDMATAGESSKLQMAEASEASRLDTASREADMQIQQTQMSAEDRMQQAQLGEAASLQMAEAAEQSRLDSQAAQGDMEIQSATMQGQLDSASLTMQKESTLMDSYAGEVGGYRGEKAAADKKAWSGVSGMLSAAGGLSDKRAKENIIKIKYSDSGIPIYHFNYIGDKQTWSGTMAQDLLELGRKDAVGTRDGLYTVNYNLIDVDMKKVIPSPLKQIEGAMGANPQEHMQKSKQQTSDGLDIIGAGAKRLAWEDMQLDIKSIEPQAMQDRKAKDHALRKDDRDNYDDKQEPQLAQAYTGIFRTILEKYKQELLDALNTKDKAAEGIVKTKMAALKSNVQAVKDCIREFREDHFANESLLSKGVSAQQVSFATQLYCDNPDLQIANAVGQDILKGYTDWYGKPVVEDGLYAFVYDFTGRKVMMSILDGNKDMFIRNNLKATEYLNFLNDIYDGALQASKAKQAQKIDLGRINYKIDTLFGYNDGTASTEQNELVMMFCHDSEVLRDGSTFRRHLYEHPNIKDLNYGGFDWDTLQNIAPLGPGDTNYWYDNIDDVDRLRLVDAIINVDSPFFDLKLLRTLVKEYYTTKIENAWWKGMGYKEGKLELMRLKRDKLNEARFKKEKTEAAKDGMLEFLFDGKMYPTGMTKAKVKKQEEEAKRASEKANPQLKK